MDQMLFGRMSMGLLTIRPNTGVSEDLKPCSCAQFAPGCKFAHGCKFVHHYVAFICQ